MLNAVSVKTTYGWPPIGAMSICSAPWVEGKLCGLGRIVQLDPFHVATPTSALGAESSAQTAQGTPLTAVMSGEWLILLESLSWPPMGIQPACATWGSAMSTAAESTIGRARGIRMKPSVFLAPRRRHPREGY